MLRLSIARALERGRLRGLSARALASVWEAVADPVRPVALPRGARVFGVGGATLGGAGKTPVVLALARALAGGRRVAVVASAYSARARCARVVEPEEDVRVVGDEALWLARALAEANVPVVVGRLREAALALAARLADVVIVDGLLQARPAKLAASFLVLDGVAPWGAGRCPPAGDLRAPPNRLLEACDAVLLGPGGWGACEPWLDASAVLRFDSRLVGARAPSGKPVSLDQLASSRLGLVLAIARPERVIAELEGHGVVPRVVEVHADHAQLTDKRVEGLDAWLTTPKCATKLGSERCGVPLWVLEHAVALPAEAVSLAARLAVPPSAASTRPD